jgi:hypothetical protein
MRVPEAAARSCLAASAPPPLREVLTDALRYWEPRRVGYNVVLALIVLGWVGWQMKFTRPYEPRGSLVGIVDYPAVEPRG